MNRIVTISAAAVLNPGDAADVSFVPAIQRRRLSPLQKIYFSLAHGVDMAGIGNVVFSSRDGEDTLTRRIVDDFHEDGSVSPNRFSSSVYNASPGLWSVFAGSRVPYTAIAAGEDTIECALIESLGGTVPVLFVYAEETGGGYGAAFVLSEDRSVAEPCRAISREEPNRPSLTFSDLVAFITCKTDELKGRWISIVRERKR